MSNKPSVLITGAGNGLGFSIAALLTQEYNVYGTARNDQDIERLHKAGIQPIQFDFLKNSLDDLKKEIEQMPNFYSLINNAAIPGIGPIELAEEEKINQVIELNLLTIIKLSKVVIPFLRKTEGHIINIGSTSGVIASPLASLYAASKFGLKGFTESLARELRPQNIKVTHIIPGAIKTKIWNKVSRDLNNSRNQNYTDQLTQFEKVTNKVDLYAMEPHYVATKVYQVLKNKTFKVQVLVGLSSKFQYFLAKIMPLSIINFLVSSKSKKDKQGSF